MKKNNIPILIIIVAIIISAGMIYNSKSGQRGDTQNPQDVTSTVTGTTTGTASSNVTMENGIQVVTLEARGGYSPRRSLGKAGIPTVVRFSTNGTFDCSLSVRIPSLNISKILPQTGTTDISINTPSIGLFRGSCGMGMYPFEIDFTN